MEIRQIAYFMEVARAGTFSAAAKNLYVSQPALSKAMKNLEQELDTKLFRQIENKTVLTDVGEVFFEKAQVLMDDYHAILDAMKEVTALERGAVRLGIPYGLGSMLFYRLVSDFSRQYPNIEIAVSGHGSRYIRGSLLEGKIDLGVTLIPPELETGLRAFPIIEDQYFLLVSKASPLAKKKSVSYQDLGNETFIMLNDEYVSTEMIKKRCKEHGFTPRVNIVANRTDFIGDLVAQGRGIAVIGGGRWRFEAQRDIVTIALDDDLIDFHIALIAPSDGYLPLAAQKFIDYAVENGINAYHAN